MRIHTFVLPEPFSVGTVNVYLLETDRLTLIDSGPKTSEAEERLVAYLAGLGYKVTDLNQVILTHCHPDHTGLSSVLGKVAKAEVLIHPAELDSEIQIQHQQLGPSGAKLFVLAGVSKAEIAQVEANYHKLYDATCQQHAWLKDGDIIPVGKGYNLHVLHTPGHTLGHVCLWEPKKQVVFSGDQILEKLLPLPSLEIDAQGNRINMIAKYLESMERVMNLHPKYVLPGHGAMIKDLPAVVKAIFAHLLVRKQEVVTQLIGQNLSVMDLVREQYPGIKGLDLVPALSKVWGVLDLLMTDNVIECQTREGVLYYSVKTN